MASRLVFGCGYLGGRVARRWAASGDQIAVVTRDAAKAASLAAEGFDAIVADVTRPDTLGSLPGGDTVLWAVGYDRSAGGPPIERVYAGGLAAALAELQARVGRVIYISTTGVYGDAAGEWVDEATPPAPTRDGGRASLAAERLLEAEPWRGRSVALRLAGIYGPGRLPYLEQLRAGEPIAATAEGWLNLIHVDDAAAAVLAAAEHPAPPPVVCVSDGAPPLRLDYYCEAARLLGAPAPRFAPPEAGSSRAARAASPKRVRNALLARELGVTLRYPTFREGLAAILAERADR